MNPPIAVQANTTSPQGVAAVAPIAAPAPTQLPAAPAVAASPASAPALPNFAGDTSTQIGNLANYYQIPRTTAAVTGAGQAQGQVAQQQFEQQKAANQIKITNEQNSLNPSTYQTTKNADGSVTILNSVGDVVPIGTFAALTGSNPATYLTTAGATDAASTKFIEAYNNLQTYTQDKIAAQNGDAQAQAEITQYNTANPGLANMELGQLSSAFMQQYGQYFGQPQGNQNALSQADLTPTLSSLNNPSATSAFENPTYATLPGGNSGTVGTYTPSAAASGASTSNASASLSALQQEQALLSANGG